MLRFQKRLASRVLCCDKRRSGWPQGDQRDHQCLCLSADPETDQRQADHPEACDPPFLCSVPEKYLGLPEGCW
ncbi:unnamed protein product [Gulo gulo]|uniref:Uncharacterized protein n=1 Tax=Gulo gulo TaxID=48420 RepID=A0A9X9LUB3_GULGU|nr:unnamed protein product [Gulo gulo]